MDEYLQFIISFQNHQAAEASQSAESLRSAILEEAADIAVRRVRTDPEAMDMGTALSVGLAAPALAGLVKGIAAWLARAHGRRITISRPDGTLVVGDIGARQAADLAETLLR